VDGWIGRLAERNGTSEWSRNYLYGSYLLSIMHEISIEIKNEFDINGNGYRNANARFSPPTSVLYSLANHSREESKTR
jgi:hypothetical protein